MFTVNLLKSAAARRQQDFIAMDIAKPGVKILGHIPFVRKWPKNFYLSVYLEETIWFRRSLCISLADYSRVIFGVYVSRAGLKPTRRV